MRVFYPHGSGAVRFDMIDPRPQPIRKGYRAKEVFGRDGEELGGFQKVAWCFEFAEVWNRQKRLHLTGRAVNLFTEDHWGVLGTFGVDTGPVARDGR